MSDIIVKMSQETFDRLLSTFPFCGLDTVIDDDVPYGLLKFQGRGAE